MTQQKYQLTSERKDSDHSNVKVPNEELENSVTIQNSKRLNNGKYLLAEIIRSQTIPSGTTGF